MIPVHIVSGFLGAGKTTFIQHLISRWSQHNDASKVLIVENDFGEVSFDATVLGSAGFSVETLSNGCICCSLSGNFQDSLYKLVHEKDWELIVIEPSGISALSSIIDACESPKLSSELTIVGATTIIDPDRAPLYIANFGQFYKDQVSHATTLVLRPTVDAVRAPEDTIALLRQYAKDTPVLTENWDSDEFWQPFLSSLATGKTDDPDTIIAEIDKALSSSPTHSQENLTNEAIEADKQEKQELVVSDAHNHEHHGDSCCCHNHEHDHNHNHNHNHNHHDDLSDDQFCKLTITATSLLSQGVISAYVNSITSACPSIIRAKGILPTITGPITLQYTPGHWDLADSTIEGNELTIIACDRAALESIKKTHSLVAWSLSEVH